MGMLIDGVWIQEESIRSQNGHFVRKESSFRDWVRASKSARFQAVPNRYHLYVSHACPWAHRTMIYLKLKQLEDIISVSVVDPLMEDQGWQFSEGPGCIPDRINNASYLHEIYTMANSKYTGRSTVPILWDIQESTIVSNESSEIIRMLNCEFDEFGNADLDLYPKYLRNEIDDINQRIFSDINNGVYRCGFATTQEAYNEAFSDLFSTLDELERRLERQRYLVGDILTEADWRLFPTLVRFDPVYVGHFKCNQRRIEDYPHLSGYTRELYQMPGISETINLDHIKRHYYQSHPSINPTGIVPSGPDCNWTVDHGRSHL